MPCACAGHCLAERWRTCLRSNVGLWWTGTVITASRYDNSPQWHWLRDLQVSNWCFLNHLWLADWCHQWLSDRWSNVQAFSRDVFLLGYCVWWFFGVFVVSTWQQLTRLSQADMILRLSNSALQPSAVVRNLGVYVDEQLSMDDRACHCQNVLLSPATNSSTTSSPRLWHTDTSVDLVVLGLL